MFNLTYQGKSFNQRPEDNYVNLGQLCATHGKAFKDWKKTDSAQAYLEALAKTLYPSDGNIIPSDKLVIPGINAMGGKSGTWGHPLVAIEIARWISPEFGVWCNQHIKTLMETGSTSIVEQKTPQTYLQALKALVAAEEEKERLAKEKNLLETENEILLEDNERQAEVIDELFEYSSIIRIAKFNDVSEKAFKWQKLKAASQAMGVEIKKVPCPRFVTKNLYHHDAWRYVYPEYRLPETTTLVIKTEGEKMIEKVKELKKKGREEKEEK